MKKLLPLFLILALVTGCSEEKSGPASLQEKAVQLLNEYRFDEADSTYFSILRADTTSWAGPEGLALVQERQLMFWDALHFYLKILARNPRSLPGALGSMRMYNRIGEYERALTKAAYALELEPHNGEIMVEEALLALKMHRPDIALQLATQAVSNGQPESMEHLFQAYALILDNNEEAARDHINSAIPDGLSSALSYRVAADLYELRGLLDSSVAFSARATSADGNSFETTIDHFFRLIRLGYFFDARQIIDSVEAIGGQTAPVHIMNTYLKRADRQSFSVIADNNFLNNLKPYTITPLFLNIYSYAAITNKQMVAVDLSTLRGYINKGNFTKEFRDFVLYRAAILTGLYDDYLNGLHALRETREGRPPSREETLFEMYCLHNTGQLDEFDAHLDTIQEKNYNSSLWMAGVADVLADSTVKQYDDAVTFYRGALEINPGFREAFEGYTAMYDRQRDFSNELALFNAFRPMVNSRHDLQVAEALVSVKAGAVDQGVSQFLHSCKVVSGQVPSFENLLALLTELHRTDLIGTVIDTLVNLSPDNHDAVTLAAEYLIPLGEVDLALEMLKEVVDAEPGYLRGKVLYGWALYRSGDIEQAFDIFDEVSEIDQDNPDVLYYQSRALSESGRNQAEAENMARRAVFAGKHYLRNWMSLCDVYMKGGRPDLARGEAIRASNAYNYSPEPFFYIGYAMYLEGNDGARENLEKAIARGLGGNHLATANKALAELK